jgi:hypothetical protein
MPAKIMAVRRDVHVYMCETQWLRLKKCIDHRAVSPVMRELVEGFIKRHEQKAEPRAALAK